MLSAHFETHGVRRAGFLDGSADGALRKIVCMRYVCEERQLEPKVRCGGFAWTGREHPSVWACVSLEAAGHKDVVLNGTVAHPDPQCVVEDTRKNETWIRVRLGLTWAAEAARQRSLRGWTRRNRASGDPCREQGYVRCWLMIDGGQRGRRECSGQRARRADCRGLHVGK